MAYNALSLYSGDLLIYVGEWPGGCAEPKFFALLGALFAELESQPIPQWFMRDDRLRVFRRRGIPRMNAAGSRMGEPHRVHARSQLPQRESTTTDWTNSTRLGQQSPHSCNPDCRFLCDYLASLAVVK
jgi:hypothetical protein